MPAAIPLIAGSAASWAVGGGIAGAIVGGIVSYGLGQLLAPKEPDLPSFDFGDIDRTRGLNQNISNPVAPIPVVYGTYRVAGARVLTETSGTNNNTLHMVIAWCEGEIGSVDTIYFDDVPHTDSRFTGLVSFGDGISAHVGTDAQTADTVAVAALANWTTAHRLRGIAYTYIELTYAPDAFPRVPVVSADITGKEVLDVVASTTATSNNPANVLYDYLTNTRYGRGIPAAEIDLTSFQTAHAKCAALISNSPEPSQATYTCDGIVNIDNPFLDNVRDILSSCRAYLIFSGGKYKMVVDAAESSSFAFTTANITGNFQITLDSKASRYNRVRAQYYNGVRNYQPDLVIVDSSTYRTADNESLLEKQFNLPFTTDEYRARRIAEIELEQSRYTTVVEFTATLEGLRAEVGDVVTITHPTPGWVSKQFRVLGIEFDSDDTIKISAREYNNVYTPTTPPAVVTPPTVTIPPPNDILESDEIQPAASYLYGFENGDTKGWVEDDGTIAATATACVGSVAGLVTHGGGGNTSSASLVVPASFAANMLTATDNQIRLQMWARRPAAGAATGFKVRIVGDGSSSAWQTFATTTTCTAFGFVWKPAVVQTTLKIEIQGDSTDAGTGATIIDNLTLFVLPDFVKESNISTWIDSGAIGTAYIASAAITNAKIGTAAVGTLTVAGNAITVMEASEASTSACPTAWTDTGVSITRGAVTSRQAIFLFVSSSGSTVCHVDPDDDKGVTFRVLRDAVVLDLDDLIVDEPDDTSHTYKIQYQTTTVSPTYQSGTTDWKLVLFEGLR